MARATVTNKIKFRNRIVSTVGALLSSMIPEGLYLLVTVALAINCNWLRKSSVTRYESIESLARVDILCVDEQEPSQPMK